MARRPGKGEPSGRTPVEYDTEEVLRAKYVDYCSARACEVFAELEEERVFELARAVEQDAGVEQGALSFQGIAALLVGRLLDELRLPNFEQWVTSYREDPEKYEQHMLGLWRRAVEPPATRSSL